MSNLILYNYKLCTNFQIIINITYGKRKSMYLLLKAVKNIDLLHCLNINKCYLLSIKH